MHSDKVEYNCKQDQMKIRPYSLTSIFKMNKIDIQLKSLSKVCQNK